MDLTKVTIPYNEIWVETNDDFNLIAPTRGFSSDNPCIIAKRQGNVVILRFAKNLAYICDRMFLSQETITKVILPNSVTSIGNNVFYGCTSLTNKEII